MRPQKHKVKILCQIQAAGPLPPGPALWTVPPPLSLAVPGPTSGLSLQGGAVQTPEPGYARTLPIKLGAKTGVGSSQLSHDSKPGLPSPVGSGGQPLDFRGTRRRNRMRLCACTQRAMTAVGLGYSGGSPWLGCCHPGFGFGFCCDSEPVLLLSVRPVCKTRSLPRSRRAGSEYSS